MESNKTNRQLEAEVEAMRSRLEEAEETLRAITNNELDAFVVNGPEGPAGLHPTGRGTALPHPYGDDGRGRAHHGNKTARSFTATAVCQNSSRNRLMKS